AGNAARARHCGHSEVFQDIYNSCKIGTSLLSSTGTPSPLLLRKILKTNQIGFCFCFDLLFSRGYGQNLELIGVTGRAWRFFRPFWEFAPASVGSWPREHR